MGKQKTKMLLLLGSMVSIDNCSPVRLHPAEPERRRDPHRAGRPREPRPDPPGDGPVDGPRRRDPLERDDVALAAPRPPDPRGVRVVGRLAGP